MYRIQKIVIITYLLSLSQLIAMNDEFIPFLPEIQVTVLDFLVDSEHESPLHAIKTCYQFAGVNKTINSEFKSNRFAKYAIATLAKKFPTFGNEAAIAAQLGTVGSIAYLKQCDLDMMGQAISSPAISSNAHELIVYLNNFVKGIKQMSIPVLRLLLAAGANIKEQTPININSMDQDICARGKQTPLVIACRARREDVVELLLQHNDADNNYVDTLSMGSYSALMEAAKVNSYPIVKALLDKGANPNETSVEGNTALCYSIDACYAHLKKFKQEVTPEKEKPYIEEFNKIIIALKQAGAHPKYQSLGGYDESTVIYKFNILRQQYKLKASFTPGGEPCCTIL